jgi:chromosome segregation protein
MRLTKIKLAGFKSFVDPTTIYLSSGLTGIVGPNGCGKSNVIDAVRWVMGETSAKHLRGDSMEDVIFSGSGSRKPVGQASVELHFDNSDGSLGGQYAQYAEIAIKRLVSRDGQSKYFLNGARCRRRDIADIFLGTGLGPRSYSIIEQGMVSRLIEAKPEEIRVYIEEAAGISKYKERRRETENRIRHTRDNLDRLNDLREEVDKQIAKLQRQANTAERYKLLKQEEQRLRAELLALRWRSLDETVSERERRLQEHETRLQALIAEQRATENQIETLRARHSEENDAFNEVQSRYYKLGADISRAEQSIQHARDMRARHQDDLTQVASAWQEAHDHIETDRARLAELAAQLDDHAPQLEEAQQVHSASREALSSTEAAMTAWQGRWEDFNGRAGDAVKDAQVERTRIEHLERQVLQLDTRLQRVDQDLQSTVSTEIEAELEALVHREQAEEQRLAASNNELSDLTGRIARQRETNRQLEEELSGGRSALQDLRGRATSLEALQEAALGKHEKSVIAWLEHQGLADFPRLAEQLQVETGWEHAVETVLGGYLEAVCVAGADAVAQVLDSLEHGSIALLDVSVTAPRESGDGSLLQDRVHSALPVQGLMRGVRCAQTLADALAMRGDLAQGESVITPEGIWIGPGWMRVARRRSGDEGVLTREQQLKQLVSEIERLEATVGSAQHRLEEGRSELRALEETREAAQAALGDLHRQHSDLRAEINGRRARLDQLRQRRQQREEERQEIAQQLEHDQREIEAARARHAEALQRADDLEHERELLRVERDDLQARLEETRSKAQTDREGAHELALRLESLRTAQITTQQNLERMERQVAHLEQRRDELERTLADGEQPLADLQSELAGLLEQRVVVENELTGARAKLQDTENELRALDQQRLERESAVEVMRGELDGERLGVQELRVRRDTVLEQFEESGYVLDEALMTLGEGAEIEAWEKQVEDIARRIQRLGPINLAAIDEFKEESERKEYLDAQLKDLSEALETLENAIRKIDRETRSRFRDTFDRINAKVQQIFPRLFGGGSAHLEMTGDDLLSTGVAIMARPPGKRISNIHLLSGGEKAMTAVAMIFAIFDLNPAPFCMLDEVDAPLDDANVGRYCELVREMSERVQFIFITHNKLTMELAQQLTGVTMREAGVSRLVSVDVDAAVQMVAV